MSIAKIKYVSETDLDGFWNKTATPINWANVSFDPSNLTEFISPYIIPIEEPRGLISSGKPFKYRAFFHVNIHIKKGNGIGRAYELYDILSARYKEQTKTEVVYFTPAPSSHFEDGDYIILPFRILAELWGI